MAESSLLGAPGSPAGVVAVLRIDGYRRLWEAMSVSSLGDWLGLLAITGLAARLSAGNLTKLNLAVAAVFALRIAPAVVFGPLAGAVADRLDRRLTMVAGDVVRALLLVSIILADSLVWLYVATFLMECAAMFWLPAKEATVPNLVPRERLEAANQMSLLASYGSAPLAAAVFALLTLFGGPLERIGWGAVDLALWFDAATFAVSASLIFRLRAIPLRSAVGNGGRQPHIWTTILDGWRFVGGNRVVRGLIVAMLGAFAAGGAVIGLARAHVTALGGGDPAYGVLFASVFLGLAAGMALGPMLTAQFTRDQQIGLAIPGAGLSLAVLAVIPDVVLAALVALVLGAFAGLAWVSGYTLIGLEVTDELRGRTFAFLQSTARIVLLVVLAAAPLLAAWAGRQEVSIGGRRFDIPGTSTVFFVAGLLAAGLGAVSYRQMRATRRDRGRLRARPLRAAAGQSQIPTGQGFLLALEGGEGAGKSSVARLLADFLAQRGHEVVLTREPGATPLGRRVREFLLDPALGGMSDRAEALLYAADRAEHVARVIRPALARGAVVVCDRFIDSTLAYQGAGRDLPLAELASISEWAAQSLTPGLTVLLDVPPEVGLARAGRERDRMEAEPLEFHERVRAAFLARANAVPDRYVVIDASQPLDFVLSQIEEKLAPRLPMSAAERAQVEARDRAEAQRRAEAGRRAEAARQQRVAAARAEIDAHRRQVAATNAQVAQTQRQLALERQAVEQAHRLAVQRARRAAAEQAGMRRLSAGASGAARARARAAAARARRSQREAAALLADQQAREAADRREVERQEAERLRLAQERAEREALARRQDEERASERAERARERAERERKAREQEEHRGREQAQRARRHAEAIQRAQQKERRAADLARQRAQEAEQERTAHARTATPPPSTTSTQPFRPIGPPGTDSATDSRREAAGSSPARRATAGDPPTVETSLADELFGASPEDPPTVELPRHEP